MSKLEDKLSASIKPTRKQPASVKAPAGKAVTPARPSAAADKTMDVPKVPDRAAVPVAPARTGEGLNAPGRLLHPARIWPD